MMAEFDDTLQNIAENPQRRNAFVELLLDFVLDQPLSQFVSLDEAIDTHEFSRYIASSYRDLVRREQTRKLIAEGINSALDSADSLDGSLREFLPEDVTLHLKQIVGREYRANEDLVRSMIQHTTMRTVIRNVLQETLQEFVDRTTEWIRDQETIPGVKGTFNFFLRIFGMARSFTKRFSEEYEKRIEERIEAFVDDVIDESIERMIVQLTSEEMVPQLSKWRRDLVDVLLDQPIDRYLQELKKFEPEESLDNVGEIFLAVGEWDRSPDLVEALLVAGVKQLEDQPVGDLLDVLGIRATIEDRAERFLGERMPGFLESDAFREWMNGESPEGE